MLVTHIYLKGQCKEAIDLYVKAFNATIETIIHDTEQEELIIHAEILIHNQLLMLNDNNDGLSESSGYQLSVRFDSENELKSAYSVFKDDSNVILPMQATDYSSCVVRFVDKFDVRWAFWV